MSKIKPLKTIIAGSRDGVTYQDVCDAISNISWDISYVISGAARGTDRLGEEWARNNGMLIERYPAYWEKYNKKAGIMRNIQMAKNAEALIAIWDGCSKGTQHMIRVAKQYGLEVYVHRVDWKDNEKTPQLF